MSFYSQNVDKIRNFEGSDIASNPTSKLHCSDAASNNYLPKIIKNIDIFQFFAQIVVYLDFFCNFAR